MVGWQREARVRRDGEEGKNSLSTDKSEIYRKAGEEQQFGVKKVKDFSVGHNHPIANAPLVCSCIVSGMLVNAMFITCLPFYHYNICYGVSHPLHEFNPTVSLENYFLESNTVKQFLLSPK